MTGHLAKFQTVTAVSPTPMADPTFFANGPLTTSAISTMACSSTRTSVTSIWRGRSFMNERPSSTS
jgi:hypothetical protein